MKIGVLTSSRADYSIYFPLLKALQQDPFFSLFIIAFGTHVSDKFGYTLNKITEDGFSVSDVIKTLPEDDTPSEIARSMGGTMTEFSNIWRKTKFDVVFCLGDRYEMFAACASTVPFNLKLAHIHGGEQTLGAIDDAFRHAITHMAFYHFTAAEPYRERVVRLKESEKNVYNVGSLSIDNLKKLHLLTIPELKEQFKIDLSKPSILITFHPETVSFEKNKIYTSEIISALREVENYQFIITMPNADTMGSLVRTELNKFIASTPQAVGIESFGTLGYLSCMKHCSFMLGNTSSGFIEASSFPKYVVNLGNRQEGRIVTPNIRNTAIKKENIIKAINDFQHINLPDTIDIYGNGKTAENIVSILKAIFKEP